MKLLLAILLFFFSLDLSAQYCSEYKALGKSYSIGLIKNGKKENVTVIDVATADTAFNYAGLVFDKFELLSLKSNIINARKSFFDNSYYYQGSDNKESISVKLNNKTYCSGFVGKGEDVYVSSNCEINFYYFKKATSEAEAFVIKIDRIIPDDAPYMYCEDVYIIFDKDSDLLDFIDKLDYNTLRRCAER